MIEFKKKDEVEVLVAFGAGKNHKISRSGVDVEISKEKDDNGKSIIRYHAVSQDPPAEVRGEGHILRDVFLDIKMKLETAVKGLPETKVSDEPKEKKERTTKPPTRVKHEGTFKLLYVKGGALDDAYLKMPPQAKTIVDILVDADGDVFKEAAIREIVNVPVNAEKLKTRQAPTRIWEYYRSRLISAKILQEIVP